MYVPILNPTDAFLLLSLQTKSILLCGSYEKRNLVVILGMTYLGGITMEQGINFGHNCFSVPNKVVVLHVTI